MALLDWVPKDDVLGSLTIVGTGIIAAIIVDFLLKLAEYITKKTKYDLDDYVFKALRRPMFIGLVGWSIIVASLKTNVLINYHSQIKMFALIFSVLIITYGLMRFIKQMFLWYTEKEKKRLAIPIDDRYLRIIRKGINVVVFAVGIMIILNELNINITPLITSLGIGGIVVALALQETLSNFFSGFSIMSERSIKIGDLIETDSGIRGTIEDMSWRVAKIKTLENTYVLVPNSKLASAITTNYSSLKKDIDFKIEVGVSYESDLDKVEKITMDIAKKIQTQIHGATKHFEPLVRFNKFGDSNIIFTVTLHTDNYIEKVHITHEFIKELKRAYDKHKIKMNYPVREIISKK